MKRRRIFEEDRQAVSPVIATILMVAITVVLAATLYMMIDTGDDGGTAIFSGAMSVHESTSTAEDTLVMRITSMRSPSSAREADVAITVFNETGERVTTTQEWIYLPYDPDVTEGARLRLVFPYDVTSFRNYEIELRLDGVEGSITHRVR